MLINSAKIILIIKSAIPVLLTIHRYKNIVLINSAKIILIIKSAILVLLTTHRYKNKCRTKLTTNSITKISENHINHLISDPCSFTNWSHNRFSSFSGFLSTFSKHIFYVIQITFKFFTFFTCSGKIVFDHF